MTSHTLEIGLNISSVNNEQTRGAWLQLTGIVTKIGREVPKIKTESNQDTLPEEAIRLMVKRQSERIS